MGLWPLIVAYRATGADLNKMDSNGWAALHHAVKAKQHFSGRVLLLLGADPNLRTQENFGFIGEAFRELDKDPKQKGKEDTTFTDMLAAQSNYAPLHFAAQNWDIVFIRLLLDNGADPDIRDGGKRTPMSVAAEIDEVEIVRLLVNRGANINTKDYGGLSPVLYAAFYDQRRTAGFLLKRGAKDQFFAAVLLGDVPTLRNMIARGADVNQRGPMGMTGLHGAATQNHLKIALLLLQNGANPNLKLAGDSSVTPLFSATSQGHPKMVELLLRHGANPDVGKEKTNITPLGIAAFEGNLEEMKMLVKHGADINGGLSSPLLNAVMGGQLAAAKWLLAHGAKVDARMKRNGETALFRIQLSLQKNSDAPPWEMCELLIAHGANVNSRNNFGSTPLHQAVARMADSRVIQCLLKNGADPSLRNKEGKTPLKMLEAFPGNRKERDQLEKLFKQYPKSKS